MYWYIKYFMLIVTDLIWRLIMKTNKKMCQQEYNFQAFKYERVKPSIKCNHVPIPRSGHRVAADSKNLYSFGGYNPMYHVNHNDGERELTNSYPLFQELWRFNYASRVWTCYPNHRSLPQELASNAVVRHGSHLMVYGGTGSPFGQRCSNKLYICKLDDKNCNIWEVNTTGTLPIPQYGQALVYHNDYLYTVGGTTGYDYTCDIHRLNLKTLLWEAVYVSNGKTDSEPAGRYRHEVAFDGNNIYILGGGTATEVYDFENIPTFSLVKGRWSQQKTLRDLRDVGVNGIPPSRRCHGAVQINTDKTIEVFIIGGYNGHEEYSDMWKLDLNTFQWTLIQSCQLPKPTYFHSTAVSPEGKLYVFGGIITGSNREIMRTSKVYSAWLCVPKLSEMCWDALLHYNPDIVNCQKAKLLDAGLPKRFVQRLD